MESEKGSRMGCLVGCVEATTGTETAKDLQRRDWRGGDSGVIGAAQEVDEWWKQGCGGTEWCSWSRGTTVDAWDAATNAGNATTDADAWSRHASSFVSTGPTDRPVDLMLVADPKSHSFAARATLRRRPCPCHHSHLHHLNNKLSRDHHHRSHLLPEASCHHQDGDQVCHR